MRKKGCPNLRQGPNLSPTLYIFILSRATLPQSLWTEDGMPGPQARSGLFGGTLYMYVHRPYPPKSDKP